jgi:hypothetical protein
MLSFYRPGLWCLTHHLPLTPLSRGGEENKNTGPRVVHLASAKHRQRHRAIMKHAGEAALDQLEDVLDVLGRVPFPKLRKRSSASLGPKFS